MKKLRLGFLASHGGSNMQAIIDNCKNGYLHAKPVVVISNNSNSKALERARLEDIPNYHISSNDIYEDATVNLKLHLHRVDLVILAGYMKKLGPSVLDTFENKILNIHPALLPKFGGKGMYGENVHKAVLKAKETETGVTIHLVNKEYDKGYILAQETIPVLENDTVETLSARVLKLEHTLYSKTIKQIIGDTYSVLDSYAKRWKHTGIRDLS